LFWEPSGHTTRNGYRSIGNLFDYKITEIITLKKIILFEIEKYKKKFIKEKNTFITKWPNKFDLKGWHIRLIKEGYQRAHIHAGGWLSGCFYIKIPKKLNKKEGAIKFGLHGYDYPILDKNIPSTFYTPKDGDIVLFPSSLFHQTVPFVSKEERHVIAFDLVPKSIIN
jgi:uncharacterized protein (TIGR02466 family)